MITTSPPLAPNQTLRHQRQHQSVHLFNTLRPTTYSMTHHKPSFWICFYNFLTSCTSIIRIRASVSLLLLRWHCSYSEEELPGWVTSSSLVTFWSCLQALNLIPSTRRIIRGKNSEGKIDLRKLLDPHNWCQKSMDRSLKITFTSLKVTSLNNWCSLSLTA